MKEADGGCGQVHSRSMRSAVDKERTKLRERQRRSITTNIFHGLRKHGGYALSPRADINQLLRHLAMEAGWVVEPDGTTYRSLTTTTNAFDVCPACCGAGKRSTTSTPTSSFHGGGGGGIECSTAASPGTLTVSDSTFVIGGPATGWSTPAALINKTQMHTCTEASRVGSTRQLPRARMYL